jgi:hypothetical protein
LEKFLFSKSREFTLSEILPGNFLGSIVARIGGAKNRGFKELGYLSPFLFLGRGTIYFREMIEIEHEV